MDNKKVRQYRNKMQICCNELPRQQEKMHPNQLQQILEKLPGNVWWKDSNLVYLGCNDRVCQVLGMSRENFIGKTDHDIWGKEIADKLEEADLKLIKTGVTLNIEEVIVEANGRHAIMLTNKSPLFDDNNNIIGLLGTSTDITALKVMEKKLEQSRKIQEKAQNAKIQGMMEIAAGIAHEIRTPLTSIQCATDAKVYMDRLIDAYDKATNAGLEIENIRPSHMEGLRNIFSSIDAEAKEAMQIIDVFLKNLKSMVKESNVGDYQMCSIKDAVSLALARYPFDAAQKNKVKYNDVNDFKFYGVNLLVQHVIFNLMKNALFYLNDKPGAYIKIWHELSEADNLLYFRDTGPGISEYDKTRIFDFGFSKRKDGSGFGLTYCKTTMQQMGGDISVRSKLGKYTEFVLYFPKVME